MRSAWDWADPALIDTSATLRSNCRCCCPGDDLAYLGSSVSCHWSAHCTLDRKRLDRKCKTSQRFSCLFVAPERSGPLNCKSCSRSGLSRSCSTLEIRPKTFTSSCPSRLFSTVRQHNELCIFGVLDFAWLTLHSACLVCSLPPEPLETWIGLRVAFGATKRETLAVRQSNNRLGETAMESRC